MDAIGSSTKLMWFFVFIYSFPILLLILSVLYGLTKSLNDLPLYRILRIQF